MNTILDPTQVKPVILIFWSVHLVIMGIITTASIYLIYYFPKYSVKRSYLTLSQSIMDVIILIIFSQKSLLTIFQDEFGLILEEFYQKKLKAKNFLLLKESNRKIKCKNCSYICRKGWKKCPICNTKLK